MRIVTETQEEWASNVFDHLDSYKEFEHRLAYYILSGRPSGEMLDSWAAMVYNDSLGRPRTTDDFRTAYDIFNEKSLQGT